LNYESPFCIIFALFSVLFMYLYRYFSLFLMRFLVFLKKCPIFDENPAEKCDFSIIFIHFLIFRDFSSFYLINFVFLTFYVVIDRTKNP